MAKRVYIYGFDKLNRVVDCEYLEEPYIAIVHMVDIADSIGGDEVYAVDGHPRVGADFRKAIKSKDFATHLEFKDLVKHIGLRIR